MTINLANNNPRIEYSVAQGVTQTSFAVPFEFFNDTDLTVYVDAVVKTQGTHYTVSGGDGSTGTITMSVTGITGGSEVVITRNIPLERVTDFSAGADINRAALNERLIRSLQCLLISRQRLSAHLLCLNTTPSATALRCLTRPLAPASILRLA